jgi:hypothetical protein
MNAYARGRIAFLRVGTTTGCGMVNDKKMQMFVTVVVISNDLI